MIFGNSTSGSESWATKTAREIREIGTRDGSIAVVPVGSVEQHGHHLPVATDTILADVVANRGAELVAEEVPILVTPPVWSGLSPHHMTFGGTFTLEVGTMLAVLRDLAASVIDNGFDAVFFLNGHGGNMSLLGTAITKIGREFPDTQVLGLTYFQLAEPYVDGIRESDVGGMSHGGEFETSLMLHVHPELVDCDGAEATYMDDPYDLRRQDLFEGGPLSLYRTFDEYSESGAIGDPELASAEKGAKLLDCISEELEILLVAMHEQNLSEDAERGVQ